MLAQKPCNDLADSAQIALVDISNEERGRRPVDFIDAHRALVAQLAVHILAEVAESVDDVGRRRVGDRNPDRSHCDLTPLISRAAFCVG